MGINVANFEYHDPVVRDATSVDPHPILVNAEANLEKGEVQIKWFNPANDKWYCHATVYYEDASTWLSNWARTTRLVTSRIEALNAMSTKGTADKLTTDLAYSLFGKLVNYSRMYRNMKWVILNEDEAVAEVIFPADTNGDWAVPPHFIDGLVSLSGFILNGGTHFDNINNFFITPSWKSMRFAKPLVPGGRYLAYVRMVPETVDDNSKLGSYVGDVYILQDGEIVGVVEAILFREWPRVMLNRFFRPVGAAPAPSTQKNKPATPSPLVSANPLQTKAMATAVGRKTAEKPPTCATTPPQSGLMNKSDNSPKTIPQLDYSLLPPRGPPPPNGMIEKTDSDSGYEEPDGVEDTASRAIDILAEELAVDIGLLTDECEIADIGLDSLMSLVISQKLRENLGIEIRDSFYLEVTTIQDLKKLVS
jgi:monodictyphenone polyketide synthase